MCWKKFTTRQLLQRFQIIIWKSGIPYGADMFEIQCQNFHTCIRLRMVESKEGPSFANNDKHWDEKKLSAPLQKDQKVDKFTLIDALTLVFLLSVCAFPILFMFNTCYYNPSLIEAEVAEEEEARNKHSTLAVFDKKETIKNMVNRSDTIQELKHEEIKQRRPRLQR